MTPRPPHPDEIPKLPMKPGATVSRTGGRIFRYSVRYSMGIGIPEREYSSHLTRHAAVRAARRFTRPHRTDAVVGRYGADAGGVQPVRPSPMVGETGRDVA